MPSTKHSKTSKKNPSKKVPPKPSPVKEPVSSVLVTPVTNEKIPVLTITKANLRAKPKKNPRFDSSPGDSSRPTPTKQDNKRRKKQTKIVLQPKRSPTSDTLCMKQINHDDQRDTPQKDVTKDCIVKKEPVAATKHHVVNKEATANEVNLPGNKSVVDQSILDTKLPAKAKSNKGSANDKPIDVDNDSDPYDATTTTVASVPMLDIAAPITNKGTKSKSYKINRKESSTTKKPTDDTKETVNLASLGLKPRKMKRKTQDGNQKNFYGTYIYAVLIKEPDQNSTILLRFENPRKGALFSTWSEYKMSQLKFVEAAFAKEYGLMETHYVWIEGDIKKENHRGYPIRVFPLYFESTPDTQTVWDLANLIANKLNSDDDSSEKCKAAPMDQFFWIPNEKKPTWSNVIGYKPAAEKLIETCGTPPSSQDGKNRYYKKNHEWIWSCFNYNDVPVQIASQFGINKLHSRPSVFALPERNDESGEDESDEDDEYEENEESNGQREVNHDDGQLSNDGSDRSDDEIIVETVNEEDED